MKMELQADCYAGLWASQADKGPDAMLDPITQDQVDQAVKTAQSIGDDAIQKSAGRSVNPRNGLTAPHSSASMHSCAATRAEQWPAVRRTSAAKLTTS